MSDSKRGMIVDEIEAEIASTRLGHNRELAERVYDSILYRLRQSPSGVVISDMIEHGVLALEIPDHISHLFDPADAAHSSWYRPGKGYS